MTEKLTVYDPVAALVDSKRKSHFSWRMRWRRVTLHTLRKRLVSSLAPKE
jgi:hypothetical protein